MNSKLPYTLRALTIAAVIGLIGATNATAELVATPLRGDTRLVQFPYDADNTYLVLSKPKAVTHLQFAPDESIQSVAAGDTQSWEFTPTKNRKNIFVKPKFEDTETSVTVLTNKRTYQFVMKSTGDGRKWYQRVNWLYGTELVFETDAIEQDIPVLQDHAKTQEDKPSSSGVANGINPEKLRFGYEISGDAPFRPNSVFDDGKFTYIAMPEKLQELPALFTVIDGSEFAMVNYTVTSNYMVAQRIMESAVLKLGKQEIRIKRCEPKGFFSRCDR